MYSKVIQYLYSLYPIKRHYNGCNSVLYNISLLFIYFIHSSLYLLIPCHYLASPPSLSPLVTTSLFSISVSLFLFSVYICLYYFLDSTYKWYYTVFVFLSDFISQSIIFSRLIHVAANGRISFFFMAEEYSIVCVCVFVCVYTTSSLPICLLIGTLVASISWLW